MASLKARVDKHDSDIVAMKKLLGGGMKILAGIEAKIKIIADKIGTIADKVDRLAESQLKTDQQLQLLIQSLNRGNGNGHKDKFIV